MFAAHKKPEQVAKIVKSLAAHEHLALVTRASEDVYRAVKKAVKKAVYAPECRMIVVGRLPKAHPERRVLVMTAGTSDIPIAEEAALTARALGADVETMFDVGVAGIHRLFAHYEQIQKAKVCVVVAGMEGALPSIVSGIFAGPVIAVPTSVGYGASFDGLAALLTMMNACSA
ncbi:MAG: nickel pincer cofactor biosynthesis protein LarB, partial [Burkholderiales bacterium]